MFWTFLICYVVVAQVVVTGVTLTAVLARCDGDLSVFDQLNSQQRLYSLAVILLVGVFLGPVLFPFHIVQYRKCWTKVTEHSEYWSGIRNEQVRLSLESLHPANIDDDLLEHFDAQSEAPLSLGYQHLDDVWLKPQEPYCSKGRIFLHPDGTVIAEVGCTMGINYCEIVSYLNDGTIVSTAAAETNEFFEKISTEEHRYYIQCLPDSEMDELLAKHGTFLDQISMESNILVRTIPSDEWKTYFQFHSDRFGQLKYELDGGDPIDFEVNFPESNKQSAFSGRLQASACADEKHCGSSNCY